MTGQTMLVENIKLMQTVQPPPSTVGNGYIKLQMNSRLYKTVMHVDGRAILFLHLPIQLAQNVKI